MDNDLKVILGAAAVLFAAVLAIALWLSSIACAARWDSSGFQSRFGVMAGCQIMYTGRWIPEERYRAVED